jgi:hypothetical protein
MPQLLVWNEIYGTILVNSYGQETDSFSFSFIKILNVLFYPGEGLLVWTPTLIFSLLGILYFTKNKSNIGVYFIIIFMLNLLIVSSWGDWGLGNSFGARGFIELTPFFAIGLSALIDRYPNNKLLFGLFLLSVLNLFLITIYVLNLIPHNGYIGLSDILGSFDKIPLEVLKYI